MAGGRGTRFWPDSRKHLPKQLLNLPGDRTLIQQAVDRIHFIEPNFIWVVTNADQAAETARQLPQIPKENILIEPCARNTAPCVALAAAVVWQRDPDALMLTMPADHVIESQKQFQQACDHAFAIIKADPRQFVLFGIPPTFPATGYGYMERGETHPLKSKPVDSADVTTAYHVKSFREKPDKATAEQFVASGNFYWNCGIFTWKATTILKALEQYEPNIYLQLQKILPSWQTDNWQSALARHYPLMDSISIDYAVLEKATTVSVVEVTFQWDDVGSWQALTRLLGSDANGNTVIGSSTTLNTSNCIIKTDNDHLIATYGVENLIIVHTPDATLVADRNDENALRAIVQAVQEQGHDRYL